MSTIWGYIAGVMQKIFKVMSQWQISRIKSIISYIGVYYNTFWGIKFCKICENSEIYCPQSVPAIYTALTCQDSVTFILRRWFINFVCQRIWWVCVVYCCFVPPIFAIYSVYTCGSTTKTLSCVGLIVNSLMVLMFMPSYQIFSVQH